MPVSKAFIAVTETEDCLNSVMIKKSQDNCPYHVVHPGTEPPARDDAAF